MKSEKKKRIAWSLWIPVTLAFLLLIGAWATLICLANQNPTERIETGTTRSP